MGEFAREKRSKYAEFDFGAQARVLSTVTFNAICLRLRRCAFDTVPAALMADAGVAGRGK